VRSSERYRLITSLRKFSGTGSAWPFGQFVHLTLQEGASPDDVLVFLAEEGINDAVIEVKEPVIEDRFLELMDKGARA
jgi:hypothetical protein